MKPTTVLVSTGCDLRRLPIDASEAYLLSRLDGESTLADLAEITALGFEKVQTLAERLVVLGAAKPAVGRSGRQAREEKPRAGRIDPRAETAAETIRARPAPRRKSSRSVKAQKPDAARPTPKAPEVCERDTTAARRDAYDATRPPLPKESGPPPPEKGSTTPPPRPSKKLRRSQPLPVVTPPSPPPTTPREDPEKLKRLHVAAQLLAGQTKAEPLVKAADDALKKGDILGAANNYRLALRMHEDPVVREKLTAIDAHSRDLRHEKYVARARAAERGERWDEAADQYVRANEVRKDASTAERAANALRMSSGDLRLAATLAEQAVAAQPSNADYRVTLAEVYAAQKLPTRAKQECDAALAMAPDDLRAKALAAALKK